MLDTSIDRTFKYLLYSRAFRSMALIYMSLAFSLYLTELNVKLINIGLIAAATMLFMVFLTLLLGYIGDRYGFKKELLLAELFATTGAVIIALSISVAPIVIGMVIGGLGGSAGGMRGAFSPGTNAFIASNYKEERDRVMKYSLVTLTASGFAIGGSIMFSLVTPIGKAFGMLFAYRFMFGVAALMLTASFVFLLLLNEAKRPKKTTKVMKRSSLNYTAKVVTASALGGIGVGVFMPLLPLWFKLMYNASALQIGILFSIVYIATALGSYLSSRFAHLFTALGTASNSRIIGGALLFAMAISPLMIIAGLIYVARAIIAGFGSPSRTAVNVRGINNEDYGTATSVQGIAGRVSQLSSGASGYLMDLSLPMPLLIGGIFQLASGISYKILFKKRSSKRSTH
ncbi:MAG: MFS transporter [Candidatus Micrarchaeia archaeon]